jgi:poly-beta-1,6-N-acetyl-D-glucosamine synthase
MMPEADILTALNKYLFQGMMIYAGLLISSYIICSAISIKESIQYMKKNSFIDYKTIAMYRLSPSISIIAPAHNEGKIITESVRSLLSLNYPNYEVIIVNDGSTDDTVEQMLNAYQLEQIDFVNHGKLLTKPVKGVYKSKDPAFKNITFIDKVNGGKADALNVGLNISESKFIACIDADCILEQDSLLKMVKPFIEDSHDSVIATGGVVRIANSCIIENGRLVKVNLPEKLLPRVQTLEYMRSFLLGRLAWSRVNGLLLISGACGLFDKKVVLDCGGYNTKTVGEDMELVVRMKRYMYEQNRKHKVVYIPDPLCWTEAPETFKILNRQRNRWTRGTAETIWIHKKLFLNSKYGMLGLVSLPFLFFFEWLAPFIELMGILQCILLISLEYIDWKLFLILLSVVYSFAVMFSLLAILVEELTFHRYQLKKEILKLVVVAFLEPIIFHPPMFWSAIRGNLDFFTGKKTWGKMTRTGFASPAEKTLKQQVPSLAQSKR